MEQTFTFQELFLEELNDLYSAEEQIIAALPHMIAVASSGELRDLFGHYEKEVQQHLEHLKQNLMHNGRVCGAVKGMLEEAQEIIQHGGNSAVKDAALIAIVQQLQHYKIALYGSARTFARHMNYNKIMDLLQHAHNDETETDKRLTRLAEGGIFTTGINEEAARASQKT